MPSLAKHDDKNVISDTELQKPNSHNKHNISAKSTLPSVQQFVEKNIGNIGYSNLPKQIRRKCIKQGFTLNIMVIGSCGLGKSTFLRALFMSDVYNDKILPASVRFCLEPNSLPVGSVSFAVAEKNTSLCLTLLDAPGFGENLDNTQCWQPILEEISLRNRTLLEAEMRVNRKTAGSLLSGRLGVYPDPLIHVCLYFLPPTGHGIRALDLECLRQLTDKVNVVPVIGKADSMTVDECRNCKSRLRAEILRHGLRTYEFPELEYAHTSQLGAGDGIVDELRRMRMRQPFAISCSTNNFRKSDGKTVRGRVYPWGSVETDNLEHNDFYALKCLLMQYYLIDLIDTTHNVHYENFRSNHLSDILKSANFNLLEDREPLSQLECERKQHQLKLDKLAVEMNSVYLEKVREREERLKTTELDLLERIENMHQLLQNEIDDYENSQRLFNDERTAWELENRERLESLQNSFEKLEKVKTKRRGLFGPS